MFFLSIRSQAAQGFGQPTVILLVHYMFPCTVTDPSLQQQWWKHSTYARMLKILFRSLTSYFRYSVSNLKQFTFYFIHKKTWVFLYFLGWEMLQCLKSSLLSIIITINQATQSWFLGGSQSPSSWHNHQGSKLRLFSHPLVTVPKL